MKNAVMLVSSVLLCFILWTGCAKKPMEKPLNVKPLPSFNERINAKVYYDLWQEAEFEVEMCVQRCPFK